MAMVAGLRGARARLFMLLLLSVGACVDLTKVDPGPRFIDDFEDGGTPTWNRFGPWKCDNFTGGGGQGGGGQDASANDAGIADAGRPSADAAVASTCTLSLETPGDNSQQALKSVFTLDNPPDDVRQFGTEIVTRTIDGTVDLTGFSQLVFSAILESAAPPRSPLPTPGTQFLAELGCSTFGSDSLATQAVDYTLGAGWAQFRLSLSGFHLNNTPHNQSCLTLVDSIHFAVQPGPAAGASTGGTLHIDSISLQN
jgi:hypothetical protein